MRAKVQNITSTRTVYYYESRVLWINNARILACFVVVLLHVSAGVVTGIQNTDSAYWWIGNVFDSLSRWCIPVFVMISGMLLLDKAKDEPLRVFYRKRLSRILVPLLFWTLFYLLFRYFGEPLVHGKPVSILTLAGSVLNGVPYAHLWYLYMLVGLYLLVPFLRKIAWHSTRNELLFLCSALFALSILGEVFLSYYFNIIRPREAKGRSMLLFSSFRSLVSSPLRLLSQGLQGRSLHYSQAALLSWKVLSSARKWQAIRL